jgi:hypothetical protein
MAEHAPASWSWDQYASWLEGEWTTVLARTRAEGVVQRFLERHPCLLPGGEGAGESFGGHHGGWRDMVISKPSLRGLVDREPDFMWLTRNSEEIIPVLIEIESPAKRWFTKKGQRRAEFTQAQDQLAEWKQILDGESGRLLFDEMYGLPRGWRVSHRLVLRLLLIYGRRAEFEERPEWNKRRGILRGDHMEAMTFDRLRPLAGSDNVVAVKFRGQVPTVLAVPPTFRLGPNNAELIASARGWATAVTANPLLSRERKAFLKERIGYWRVLGAASKAGQSLGITSSSDWE